ncbi:MAG: hypothetical protein ACREFP_05835 [Acetobacteraceae bacterium]
MDMFDPTGTTLAAPPGDPQESQANVQLAEISTRYQSDGATEAPAIQAFTGPEAAPSPIIPLPRPVPLPPPLPIYQNVSGRYRGTSGAFQLELRVDVDRSHTLRKLSGDFYTVSGGTVAYFARSSSMARPLH